MIVSILHQQVFSLFLTSFLAFSVLPVIFEREDDFTIILYRVNFVVQLVLTIIIFTI